MFRSLVPVTFCTSHIFHSHLSTQPKHFVLQAENTAYYIWHFKINVAMMDSIVAQWGTLLLYSSKLWIHPTEDV